MPGIPPCCREVPKEAPVVPTGTHEYKRKRDRQFVIAPRNGQTVWSGNIGKISKGRNFLTNPCPARLQSQKRRKSITLRRICVLTKIVRDSHLLFRRYLFIIFPPEPNVSNVYSEEKTGMGAHLRFYYRRACRR